MYSNMESILPKFEEYPQTLSWGEITKLKSEKYYQTIFNSLLIFLNEIYLDETNKIFLDRILEFYIYPQNYNDLAYASLYRDASTRKYKLEHGIARFTNLGIIRRVDNNSRSYRIFEEHVEVFLKREIILSEFIKEID